MATLIVIGGPTASGKTNAAIKLANFLNCPILSADSRQFYKEMSIGTAKPNEGELSSAEHLFIDNKSIGEEFSAGAFENEAIAKLDEIFDKQEYSILVGGSGLYIDALCFGLDNLPKSADLRTQLNKEFETFGLAKLQEDLKKADPEYFASCDNQNPIRVIRALELIRLTRKKMSDLMKNQVSERRFKTVFFVLDLPRTLLYERIDNRVDTMLENGLLEEAKSLYPFKDFPALKTVGYQELFGFFEGEYDLDRAIELIKRNSRRYAKRQITWFKRYQNAHWVSPNAFEDPAAILELVSKTPEISKVNQTLK